MNLSRAFSTPSLKPLLYRFFSRILTTGIDITLPTNKSPMINVVSIYAPQLKKSYSKVKISLKECGITAKNSFIIP